MYALPFDWMKLSRKIIAVTIGILAIGTFWFEWGRVPGYQYISPRDLLRIRRAVRRDTSEPIVRIVPEHPGALRVITGRPGSGLDGGGIEYQLNETSTGWIIVGRSSWMSALPQHNG
jgi:hypothetical protein